MDAANIDLKGFSEGFYKNLCSGKLAPVLETLEYLKHETNVWFEITTLLIPGENDSAGEIEAESAWVMDQLGPDVPLHFTAFHPDWKLMDRPSTPPQTCVKYHVLAAPLVTFSFSERDGLGIWSIDPILHPLVDQQLYRFVVELQISVHLSLQRDVMGPSFVPREITLTYPQADDFRLVEATTGCRVRFEQPANQFIFDRHWMDKPPKLGNRTTYAAVINLCDELLADLSLRTGVAGKIRSSLLQDMATRPTFAATAKQLNTTTRTLRRQLQQQGTSFRKLVDELRAQVAVKYLRDTVMTNEDIATAVGFSDPANFRHAFRRWTGKTPGEFRRGARRAL